MSSMTQALATVSPDQSRLAVGALLVAGLLWGLTWIPFRYFGSQGLKLRRLDVATGRTTIIEVDLKDVRNGKKPDPRLLPNDVVMVSRKLI